MSNKQYNSKVFGRRLSFTHSLLSVHRPLLNPRFLTKSFLAAGFKRPSDRFGEVESHDVVRLLLFVLCKCCIGSPSQCERLTCTDAGRTNIDLLMVSMQESEAV